jgi:hypothetical protein
MATYGGIDIFIRPFATTHNPRPSAQQLSDFFGVSGQQALWGGFRGRLLEISGMLYAPDMDTLNAYEGVWTAPQTGLKGDGIARDLVDTRGRTWPSCLCMDFQPESQVRIDPQWGYFFRYRSAFHGLV